MQEDSELKFIANILMEVPKEKKYLLKYFSSRIQRSFLRYYFTFGTIVYFSEHTGYNCTKRWLRMCRNRLEELEAVHAAARANFDLDGLEFIESGKYKCRI
jgi:hypothetical protein